MKIIHLSDTHIYTNKIHGIDPAERLRKALKHILNNHNDADLFAITGDITDLGDKESYKLFLQIIKNARLPQNLNPKLIIGNHDNREEFKINLPSVETDENGFIQYYVEMKNRRFIFIDTNLINTHVGHYCTKRQKWLKKTLDETPINQEVYIFMHHNPLALVKDESDGIGLKQKEEFKKILLNYNKNIKHIFFGHQHITSSGSYCGITFSSPRSTWSPLVPNFSNKYRLGTANTDANYSVAIVRSDALIIHSEDFLKTNVNWFTEDI